MKHDPLARPREHPRERDLAWRTRMLGDSERAAGDREHRRRQLTRRLPVPARELTQPTLDAGRGGLDLPALIEHEQPWRLGTFVVCSLADQKPASGALRQMG